MRIQQTKNYAQFDVSPLNRNLHNRKSLKQSMRKNGFIPSCAIHVKKRDDGKLEIVRGHHRFETARELKLPVYYIIDNDHTDIFDLECSGNQKWSAVDFAVARSNDGNADCGELLEISKKYKAPVGTVARLLSCKETTVIKLLREGKFEIDPSNRAEDVLTAVTVAKDLRYPQASHTYFIRALHFCAQVPGFNLKRFIANMQAHPEKLVLVSNLDQCFSMIEDIHNRKLAFDKAPAIKMRAQQLHKKSIRWANKIKAANLKH